MNLYKVALQVREANKISQYLNKAMASASLIVVNYSPLHVETNLDFLFLLSVCFKFCIGIYTPTTKCGGGAILDSLCRVGWSVRLQFVSAL